MPSTNKAYASPSNRCTWAHRHHIIVIITIITTNRSHHRATQLCDSTRPHCGCSDRPMSGCSPTHHISKTCGNWWRGWSTWATSATSATDLKFFKKFGFNACVYDEGHQLKNQNTNNYRNLMQVRAKWRLLLTGTPLQNNLLELMSLLKFIMPSDFKNASEALETIFKSISIESIAGSMAVRTQGMHHSLHRRIHLRATPGLCSIC